MNSDIKKEEDIPIKIDPETQKIMLGDPELRKNIAVVFDVVLWMQEEVDEKLLKKEDTDKK